MTVKKTGEFTLALICMLGAVFLFHHSFSIALFTHFSLGPLFFPRVILGAIFVLSACLVWRNLEFGARRAPSARPGNDPAKREGAVLRVGVIVLLLIYLLVLPSAGYVVSTTAYLFASMAFLGPRTLRMLGAYLVISAAVTLSLQYLFGGVLKLFLP